MRFPCTIDDRLRETGGYTTGFDYLRLVLAVAVFSWHTVLVCDGEAYALQVLDGPLGNVIRVILPMFFALSGFLVASSLQRSKSLSVFLGLRALRIAPALSVEICLSALVLGPLLTAVSLNEYFSDPAFRHYFLNIFGLIHYELSGVFLSNIYPNLVNGSLWTVPWELECYIALAGLALVRIAPQRPKLMVAAFVAASVVVLAWNSYRGIITVGEGVPGRVLVLYFLAAVTIFLVKEYIPYSFKLFVAAVVLSFVLMMADKTLYLSPITVAYATVYLGLQQPRKIPVLMSGDYSYGIYLYAFPIQQTIALKLTSLWYLHLPATAVSVFAFAAFSWHFIEKPTLGLKRWLKRAAPSAARATSLPGDRAAPQLPIAP
jgi:peptidoglycan/LPS O-acetylase OafA/YrhL